MPLNAPTFVGTIRIAPIQHGALDRPWDDSSLELLLESLACRGPAGGGLLVAGRWTRRPKSSNTGELRADLGSLIAELEAELAQLAGAGG